ncbi:MAG TPA: isocitrate lyase/phosphoenolpyruvate mutase family protein [Blastocatellia bacterium]|jgi:2-methylisocitrate lyase-like PEP mutase family enzyme|nr:isocitrate lyase/phosphoenolpyruvate mutase family protein [Blastocatellia bacterium]
MRRTIQRQRAEAFHRLHAGDGILVLINAWDAASARLFEQAGSPAIATTSAGMAWSLGYSDGEHVSAPELLEACARICRVVTAPVSVDIERGYGRTPAEVSTTVRALLELGVVGINIEDGLTPGTKEIAPPSVLAEKISAIRAVAEEAGAPLFINARTDTYLAPTNDPGARYEDTVRRAQMYVAAGADGVFAPGLESLEEMARLAQAVERPLNIYAGYAGLPPVAELRRAGVRRVSLGCGPFQAALALARRIATETLNEGTYTAMTTNMLSTGEVNKLFLKA